MVNQYIYESSENTCLKTPSDFLWRLIHSLTAAEKGYFKRNYRAGRPGEMLYMQLFSAIASQKVYDEKALVKKFQPAINAKNIASQKHYLQKEVANALIDYHNDDDGAHQIYKNIQLVRLYRTKGLADEAHAIWKKAVATSRESESFGLLSLLKNEFEKILLFANLHTDYKDLHSVFKGNIISYREYIQLMTLRDIYTETLLLKRHAHFDFDDKLREQIGSLLSNVDAIEKADYGQSFWFRHYYRMNKATLLYLLGENKKALKLLKICWIDWKANPGFIQRDAEFYIELMYMINYAGILESDYAYVEAAFNDEVNELVQDRIQRASFEVIKYLALNKIYNKTARYGEVVKLQKVMLSNYKEWEPRVNSDLNRTLNLSLGIGCFVLEQYEDALYFLKRGITYFTKGVREEHVATAQILLLLTSYCLNNSRIFDGQYRTTYSYFYKQKKKRPFETALIKCLHRTFYMKDSKSKVAEYKNALSVFEENKEDIVQRMAFNIFNYPAWLISKVQRIPYRQYVERKVKSGSTELPA
jgi:hypothetical protein